MGKTILKDKVLEEYRKSLANVTITCRKCNIDRVTFYNWLKKDPEFAAAAEDIKKNEVCDFIEDALMKRIYDGDTTAIIFAAKTRLKDRGYVERQEQMIIGNPFEDLIKRLPEPEDK